MEPSSQFASHAGLTGEVAAFDVIEAARALQRRWTFVVAATIAGAALSALSLLFTSSIWEADASMQLGAVHGKPLEEPGALTRFLESDAFTASIPDRLRIDRRPIVRSQALASNDAGAPTYLRIRVRASSAEQARELATYVLDAVNVRHAEPFDSARREFTQYHDTLARIVKELETSIARIEENVSRLETGSRETALTALVLQTQLEGRRSEYLRLARELRDSGLLQNINTRSTKPLGEVSVAASAIWPRSFTFAVVGGALGLLLSVTAGLLLDRREAH